MSPVDPKWEIDHLSDYERRKLLAEAHKPATAADMARVLAAVRGESVDRTVLATTDSFRHLIDIEIAPAAAQRPDGSASASAKLDAGTVDTARRTAPCRWVVPELVEPVSGDMYAFGTIRT